MYSSSSSSNDCDSDGKLGSRTGEFSTVSMYGRLYPGGGGGGGAIRFLPRMLRWPTREVGPVEFDALLDALLLGLLLLLRPTYCGDPGRSSRFRAAMSGI